MPRPQYRLSNRQLKELLVRGQSLRILLPAAADSSDDDDPVEFARERLPEQLQPLVSGAAWEEVAVAPTPHSPGLTGVLGALISYEQSLEQWHYLITVCAVTLTPPDCRGSMRGNQWPGSVVQGPEEWPRGGDRDPRD